MITYARQIAALGCVAAAYLAARLPTPSAADRAALAGRFHFTRATLAAPGAAEGRKIRGVHRDYQRISAWISSVGASVALADLDGDGLADDLCLVDTRTDQVVVMPVPGTGARYQPQVLAAGPRLPFDASTTAPMGCLPFDADEDGATDLVVYYWGRTPVLFLRRGDGYLPSEIAPTGERWFTNAATTADLDGDGHADLVFGNYFADGARVLDTTSDEPQSMQRSMSLARNGGTKRLLRWAGHAAEGVRFDDVSATALPTEVARSWTLALGACDLDGDLLPELYVANDFGPDFLLHNRSRPGEVRFAPVLGQRGFTRPGSKIVGRDSFKGMGVDFADVNRDGRMDIFVSNIAQPYALEESHFLFVSRGDPADFRRGIAPYDDQGEPAGLSRSAWAWEARLDDFDNDGDVEALQATGFVRGEVDRWPELQELAMSNDGLLEHPGVWPRVQPGDDLSGRTRNPFYVRAGDRYVDVADLVGLDEPGVSRGIAVADVDGDGDLDLAVANQWADSSFWRNDCPACARNRFLGLRLLLPIGAAADTRVHPGVPARGEGTPAIGAWARVRRPDGTPLIAMVDGGNGHSGRRSPELHFGLGPAEATAPVAVDLRWRDRRGQVRALSLSLMPGWHTVVLASP
jgi:hypothetical protein